MNGTSATELFNEATGLSIGMAIVMIVLGFVALFLRGAAGLGVCVVVSWVMVFSGFAYLAYAFAAQGVGAFIWRMLIGVAYVIGGAYLAFHPGLALESLTLVVAVSLILAYVPGALGRPVQHGPSEQSLALT